MNKKIGETGNLARGLTETETLVGPQYPLSTGAEPIAYKYTTGYSGCQGKFLGDWP